MQTSLKWNDYLYALIFVLFFGIFTEIFYRMTIGYNHHYQSDFDAYANMASDAGNYAPRLVTIVYGFLYDINQITFEMAIFSGLVCACIILANYLVISSFLKRDNVTSSRLLRQFASIALLFAGSIYVPVLHPRFYKECWSSFAWHSPTQQAMTLFALLTLFFFMRIYDRYETKIPVWAWLGFLVSLALSALSKPSFMLAFAPALIVAFLLELFTARGKGTFLTRFRQLIIFGLACIPAGLYVIYLKTRLFTSESDNQIVTDAAHNLQEGLVLNIVFGLAFPLVVLLVNWRRLHEMQFRIIIWTALIGFLEWALLMESGDRAAHGNFGWARMFGCYALFLCSYVLAIENLEDRNFLKGRKALRILYFGIIGILFALHLLSQLMFFSLVLRGHWYWC